MNQKSFNLQTILNQQKMELSSANSLMAVHSTWGQKQTFRLIPVTNDAVYSEGIYDPDSKVLILMTREIKQQFHMVTKLDDNGFPVPMKTGKAHSDGSVNKKERKQIETYNEHYIVNVGDIELFMSSFVFNKEFDYKQFLQTSPIIQAPKPELITQL